MKSLDAARPVFGLKPLTSVMDAALDQPRLNAAALGTFAAAALVLAALGLYGLLMLLVAQRRRELGVRMALGATPRDLVRVVLAGAGRLVAAGVAAGLVLTLAAGHLLRAMLFGVGPYQSARPRGRRPGARSRRARRDRDPGAPRGVCQPDGRNADRVGTQERPPTASRRSQRPKGTKTPRVPRMWSL